MNSSRNIVVLTSLMAVVLCGCGDKTVDMSQIRRPARPVELDAYNVFVGSWDWKAEMLNSDAAHRDWTGTAEWKWALDDRALHGVLSAKSGDLAFESAGLWSCHPDSKKYVWWMFNNWGYMQNGKAEYDAKTMTWKMTFKSTGLDGSPSEGYYLMRVKDNNTLDWELHEWSAMRMVRKLKMRGTYTRRA